MFWGEGQLIHNGKYKIEKQLGSGAFAVTYQALQTNLNRRVVIKTPNQNDQNDPDYVKYVELFKKEAQMLTKCCADIHAHIVQVIELFEEDGRHCLVMLYIPGKNLWLFVRDHGALPETDAVKYIRQIGLALVEVHQKGILHLDVTPPNIMLNFDPGGVPNSGKAVLIDFGIGGDTSPRSSFSRSFGNKTFAPYELLSKGIRHPTVDVYCLAASLYYAVTGQCPTDSLERKLYNEELVPPKKLVPSLSDAVNQAILQGMALEAKDRSQTMHEWLNLLLEKCNMGLDYSNLENLLKAGKWQKADEETAKVILKVAGRETERWLDIEHINNFPCNDLRTIDQLWIKYSYGRFGFKVQKRIWNSIGGNHNADFETWFRFCDRVGWRVKNEYLNYNQLQFKKNAPVGHLPCFVYNWCLGQGADWGRALSHLLQKL